MKLPLLAACLFALLGGTALAQVAPTPVPTIAPGSIPGANIGGVINQATNVRSNVIDLTKPPYSIDPTGTIDATATIQNAINNNSSPNVEFDLCPSQLGVTGIIGAHYKISSTIQIGNGSASARSTSNYGIKLAGCGSGAGSSYNTPFAGTSLVWAGATGGTAVQMNGPIQSVDMEGLYIDCNGICNTGLATYDVNRSYFNDIWVQNYAGYGLIISVYQTDSTIGGAQYDTFVNFGDSTYVNPGSVGMQLGYIGSSNTDPSGITFIGINLTGAEGAVIALTDADQFYGGSISGTSLPAIQWDTELSGTFPGSLVFYDTGFGGTASGNMGLFNVTGTWNGGPGQMAYFDPWNDGGGNNPPDPTVTGAPTLAGGVSYFAGVTTSGKKFGPDQQIRYSNNGFSNTVTSSGLFNNIYNFPVQYFEHVATAVHVKADIYANETVAGDTLVPYLTIGGYTCSAMSFTSAPITLANQGNDIHVNFDFSQFSQPGSTLQFLDDAEYMAQGDSVSAGSPTPLVGLTNAGVCSPSLTGGNIIPIQVGVTITGTHSSVQLKRMIVTSDYAENH